MRLICTPAQIWNSVKVVLLPGVELLDGAMVVSGAMVVELLVGISVVDDELSSSLPHPLKVMITTERAATTKLRMMNGFRIPNGRATNLNL